MRWARREPAAVDRSTEVVTNNDASKARRRGRSHTALIHEKTHDEPRTGVVFGCVPTTRQKLHQRKANERHHPAIRIGTAGVVIARPTAGIV
jgi:hypothetical protein